MPERWVQLAQEVTCDQPRCGQAFQPRICVRQSSATGEDWMFRCPRCGHRYDIVHISPQGVSARAELLRVRVDTEMDAEERERMLASLQEELARETIRLHTLEVPDGSDD